MNEVDKAHVTSFSSPRLLLETILKEVGQMQQQQDAWNEEMHQFFVKEAIQKEESDRLTQQVQAAEAISQDDDVFHDWMSRRAEFGLGEDMIKEWYHIDGLVKKTPFLALVPCPRCLSPKGESELVSAVDALHLQRFLIQTVPLHISLSKLAPTFIALPFHFPTETRLSKSCLGNLPYIGVPCDNGSDILKLILQYPTLASSLDKTPCLFLNDHVPRSALCLHAVTVGGRCVAAEVACDVRLARKFGLDLSVLEQENSGNSIEALALALKTFVEEHITPFVEGRSFRVLLLGDVLSGREPNAQYEEMPLIANDLHFSLLNMDVLDGCEFECFKQEDILDLVQKMTQCPVTNGTFLPVLRFLKPSDKKTTSGNTDPRNDE